MKIPISDKLGRIIRENNAGRATFFYFQPVAEGMRIYCSHSIIWDLIDRFEASYGWGALHGAGDPITRMDETLSFFLVRGSDI